MFKMYTGIPHGLQLRCVFKSIHASEPVSLPSFSSSLSSVSSSSSSSSEDSFRDFGGRPRPLPDGFLADDPFFLNVPFGRPRPRLAAGPELDFGSSFLAGEPNRFFAYRMYGKNNI